MQLGGSDNKLEQPTLESVAIEFNEHESAKFVCRSSGSAPPAHLRWLWNKTSQTGKVLAESSSLTHSSGASNKLAGFTSTSLFEARALDSRFDGAELWCVATNGAAPDGISGKNLSAKVRLSVKCK